MAEHSRADPAATPDMSRRAAGSGWEPAAYLVPFQRRIRELGHAASADRPGAAGRDGGDVRQAAADGLRGDLASRLCLADRRRPDPRIPRPRTSEQ